jgi:hypothetical protein
MGKREMHRGFWWGDLREGDHLGDRRRWEDNIKMDLQEVGWVCMDWKSWLSTGEVAGCCERGNEPLDSIKCGEFLD